MNTKNSNTNNTDSTNTAAVNDSKLTQFNLFFEYDNSVSTVRKNTRDRAIR